MLVNMNNTDIDCPGSVFLVLFHNETPSRAVNNMTEDYQNSAFLTVL